MVSERCKMVVRNELEKLEVKYAYLDLGEVNLLKTLSANKKELLKIGLHKSGLELMDDKNAMIVEKIKNIVVEMVHYSDEMPKVNFSVYLSEKLSRDYHSLSELFSRTKGITIEQYIILHKIERAKELLMYDELTLSEIAFKMHYSSVAHLSNQFKKMTGLTPSFFKSLNRKNRKTLESL